LLIQTHLGDCPWPVEHMYVSTDLNKYFLLAMYGRNRNQGVLSLEEGRGQCEYYLSQEATKTFRTGQSADQRCMYCDIHVMKILRSGSLTLCTFTYCEVTLCAVYVMLRYVM
jgi:hypothetical protein